MTVSREGLFEDPGVELGLTGRPVRELPQPAPLDRHGPATIIFAWSTLRPMMFSASPSAIAKTA